MILDSYISKGYVTYHIDLFLRVDWVLVLKILKLLLTHNRLTNINPIHVTAITVVSEAGVQIITLEADPITDTLHLVLLALPCKHLWALVVVAAGVASRFNLIGRGCLWIFPLILEFTAILDILIKFILLDGTFI